VEVAQEPGSLVLGKVLAAPNDDAAALMATLEAWRTWRTPRLARLVEVFSARAVGTHGPIPGLSHDDRRLYWAPAAEQRDPMQYGRLLGALGGSSGRLSHRNLLLLAWADDPRLTGALHDLVLRPRVVGPNSRPLWTLLFDVLCRFPDPRTIPALHAVLRSPLRFSAAMQQPIVRRAAATIDHVRLALRDVPAIPEAESLELTHLEDRLGLPALPDLLAPSATLEQMRAAVFAAPADDVVRMVYGDALMSMGHPHGELIALQFARGVEGGISLREAELLRQHSLEWAGPLGVCSREVRYSRGFPSVVVLHKSRWHTRRAIPAPEWATVEEIDAGELGDDSSCIHELLWKARLPELRKLSGVTARVASELEHSALRPGVEIAPIA
jgi:uncharacterized protein (TIGR02996 family)